MKVIRYQSYSLTEVLGCPRIEWMRRLKVSFPKAIPPGQCSRELCVLFPVVSEFLSSQGGALLLLLAAYPTLLRVPTVPLPPWEPC